MCRGTIIQRKVEAGGGCFVVRWQHKDVMVCRPVLKNGRIGTREIYVRRVDVALVQPVFDDYT